MSTAITVRITLNFITAPAARKHVWRHIVGIERFRINRGFRNVLTLECGHSISRRAHHRIPRSGCAKCPECTEAMRAGELVDIPYRPATGYKGQAFRSTP